MKYFVKFVVITFFLFFSTYALSEDKIVFIDMKYVLNNSKAGKNGQDFLKKKLAKSQKEFTNTEKKLKKEEGDLLSKKTVLSKEEFSAKSDALRKQVIEYQKQRKNSFKKIAKLRTEARQTLLGKLNPILEKYVEENNISAVLDKKYIIVGTSNNDITTLITEKLNKELPSLNLK